MPLFTIAKHLREGKCIVLVLVGANPIKAPVNTPIDYNQETRRLAEETAARVGAIEDELRRVGFWLCVLGLIAAVRWLLAQV
jgi:uncharacterized protein YjeT (DUF2065 family)